MIELALTPALKIKIKAFINKKKKKKKKKCTLKLGCLVWSVKTHAHTK